TRTAYIHRATTPASAGCGPPCTTPCSTRSPHPPPESTPALSLRHSPSELDALGALARDVADAGGELARAAFARRSDDVTHKGAVDLVTETDFAVEALVHDRLIAETGFAFL